MICKAKTLAGKWIEGQHVCCTDSLNKHYISTGVVHETAFHGGKILTHDLGEFIEVDPTTICRATGKKDNSDVEIYEGDYIRGSAGIYKIIWDEKKAAFSALDGMFWFDSEDWKKGQVVGSIHEETKP